MNIIETIEALERLESHYFMKKEYDKAKRVNALITVLIDLFAEYELSDTYQNGCKLFAGTQLACKVISNL